MAINLKFDLMGNPEPPSIVLANRNGNKLGQLNVNVDSIDVSDKFNAASEFSFTLNKYIDGELTPLWDKVKDFKLVYCPEWDLWFEIKVELDETTETIKTVFCTQLGQAELSQIKVYNIHINEEGDPNWDTNNETYKSTILYDPQNIDASLLHRLLKDKAPHYSIAYVDESIQRIQKSFSFDDTSICDAFDEIAEEIGCLFVYNSNSTKGGKPSRTISVYDLQQKCNDCGHRGEFTDKCPKCEGKNIKYGYGEDTTIFVTSDELATEGIQLVTDVDSVKNCFKLEGGDDLMTATIRNCNPNGSDYIWYFSDTLKEDMSKELVAKIESYDKKYQDSYKNHPSKLDETSVNQYNTLVDKYKEYYNTKSTCLSCGHEDYFQEKCPKCNSQNILNGHNLQTITTEINGYPELMTAYYNTIDLLLYLESSLMPKSDIESNKTTAKEQIELLTTSTLSPVAVNVKEVKNITGTTAKSAVLSMAKVLVKSTYKVDVVDGSSSLDETVYTDDTIGEYKKWTGKFVVTNYSDEEDSATSEIIEVFVGNDAKTFVEQKIDKALNKENTDDYSITGLFAKEYDDFCAELKKYALNPLDNFSKICDAVISILAEQGVGDDGSNEDNEIDKATKKALYDALYKPYFEKQQVINTEMAIRESEIAIIEGVWDKSDDNNPKCTTWGLQQYIEKCQQDIQEALDFEKHLGADLWLEFCTYRREDKYSNSNYVSDGLNNAELFDRALEFIRVAEEEIFKSAELQHSISATLNNLLSLPKFKPLLKSFKTGNWIRVQVDDKVYKLRLLEYGFGYGDSESISVEFSDVTKIKNGVTDVKEVLEQASSMASSYDSVQRQAEKGNVARSTIDQWIVDGLDSADVQIKSNDSEEILLTKSGLLARSYDDITGTYLPEQFKLTHNIMAYTDDGWKTVSSALGKHNYKKWNGSSFVDDEGYGLTSKFVTAGYITGSQIIGGEIVSSNYDPKTKGTYINLLNGDFDFAGGKIVYDSSDNEVKLKGVTIQWTGDDGVNAPEVKVENITGLDKYLDQLEELEDQLDGRVQTYSQTTDPSDSWTDEEKANHIGDLWINSDSGITKRWTGTEWVEVTDSDLKELAESKAQIFTSQPIPPYYVGDLWVQGSTGDILHCINPKTEGQSYNESDWVISSKYTDDTALNDFISGDYTETLEQINQRIKNAKSRSWYQEEDPSQSWDNTENHIGDLWYCCDENQKTYIYTENGWQETNVPKEVFDTIDGKRQIFVSKPNSPYRTGDLWIISDLDCNSEYNIINGVTYLENTTLVAKLPANVNERESYVASDWIDISTHDGKLALDNSSQALELLSDIASDSKITPSEKQQLKLLMDNITSDKNDIISQCNIYSIDSVNYVNKYNALANCIYDLILVDIESTTDIPDNYANLFSEYYDAKEAIVTSIEQLIKQNSNDIVEELKSVNEHLDQVDGRIQTYCQSTPPSDGWSEEEKKENDGDIWIDTKTGATYQWDSVGLKWDVIANAEYIESLAKMKAQIFTSLPTVPYHIGDLIIPNENFTFDNITYYKKFYYVATVDSDVNEDGTSCIFNNNDWTGLDYTNDDALTNFIDDTFLPFKEQVDGKAEIWCQQNDPSTSWGDDKASHEGDIWHDTNVSKTYVYVDGNWEESNVPQSVIDAIDGKRQVFVTQPTNVDVYNTGDLWILDSNTTINNVSYQKDVILVANVPSGERVGYNESDWTPITTHDGLMALDNSKQAIDALNDIGNDSSITPTEKQQIKFMMQNITSEYNDILKQCSKYSITTTNFENAYNNLKGLTDDILVDLTTTISPLPFGYPDLFTEYYSAKELIISDIEDATKEYSDNSLSNFIDNEYATTIQNIRNEIDEKAETWYQSNDPSGSWVEDEYPQHVGDLWHYTGATTNTRGRNSEWIWLNISGVYQWVAMDVPDAVFDKIDGKATIYVANPSDQSVINVGDLLIPTKTDGNYVEGKVYRWNGTQWSEIKYTDDSAFEIWLNEGFIDTIQDLQQQIDGKANTYYQAEMPTWENANAEHVGDMWYCTADFTATDGTEYFVGKTYMFDGESWVEVENEIPQEVFDLIDGKAAIYIAMPTDTSVLNSGDLMILLADDGDYKANKVYRWTGLKWVEISYSDDSSLNEFIDNEYATTIQGINNQIDKKSETWYQSNDPSESWTTDELRLIHVGDLWFNINDNKNYIYNSAYSWVEVDGVPDEVYDAIDGKSSIYTQKPNSQEQGDLLIPSSTFTNVYSSITYTFIEKKIYRCIETQDTFRPDLWSEVAYTDDTALNTFIEGAYANNLQDVKSQIDGKAQTWYQASEPSWSTNEEKQLHVGDLWCDTDNNGKTYIYNSSYEWEEMNGVPKDVFDMADGSCSLFVNKPSNYRKNDIWILNIDNADGIDATYPKYDKGTFLVSSNDNDSYAVNDWSEQVKYTNDNALNDFISGDYADDLKGIQTQVDGKARSWYQDSDPSKTWNINEDHEGDLWYNSATDSQMTYIYDNGAWKQTNVPKELFDKIDGIASIYVTIPDFPVVGDLLIPAIDIEDYKAGKVYRYNGSTWNEIKYTDDSALNIFIDGEYADDLNLIQSQLDKKAETWYQVEDPSISWITNELKELHVGDLWYNTSAKKSYMYNASYTWVEVDGVPDSVYNAINRKAQIFTSTPTPPYYIGDLWVQGSTGDILFCENSRYDGESYSAVDWAVSSKYTDDTRADEAYGLADSAKGIADNAKEIGDKLVNGLGFQETEITGSYVISPIIAGGTLLIGDTTGTYAQITTDGLLKCANAQINGDIVANSLILGDSAFISSNKVTGLSAVATSGSYDDLQDKPDISQLVNDAIKDGNIIIETSDVEITEEPLGNGITKVTTTVGDNTYTTYSSDSANYILTNMGLGVEPDNYSSNYTSGYFKVSKEGLLVADNAIIWGTIYATDGRFSGDIEADSLTLREDIKLGNDTNGYHTWISKDGVLSTENANISGEINAAKGQIGGFTIEPTETVEGEAKSGGWLYNGESIGSDKSIFLSATDMSGTITFTEYEEDEDGNFVEDDEGNLVIVESQSFERDDWRVTVGNNFGVTRDGSLFANDAILNDCTITGGTFKIGNDEDGYHTWISEDGVLSAQGAHIDGTITADGDMGKQYPSLVSVNETSPICFKAGGVDDVIVIEEETLTCTSDGNLWSETRSFDDEQLLVSAQCLTSNKVHEGSGTSQISITNVMAGNGYYYGSTTVELLPSWVSEEHIVELSVDSSEMQVSYVGDGKVKVDIRTFSVSPADTYVGFVTYHYKFVENLNVSTEIVADKNEVTFSFEPQINGAKYEIDVQYELEPKKRGFKVLKDGSLYASAANITGTINATNGEFNGTIYATNGEIGGCSIVDGVLKIANANISEKLVAENIDGTNLDVINGTFSGSISVNNGEFEVQTDGTMIANKATITGGAITMPDESDKWIELGTGGGLRVLDLEAGYTGYYACAQYSANVLRYGRSTSFNGEIENTNALIYDCYSANPYVNMTGTWKLDGAPISTSSDKNLKHDIMSLDINYTDLFDNLQPVKFKYNNGTSERYHTGFIAQDVCEAIGNAGLTTKDFAAYVEFANAEDNTMECGLRYEEFIALCVNEIQKLKKRVAELENK